MKNNLLSAGKIVLVRHGETEWSRTGRHTGHTDISLTEEGKHQARRLKSLLADLSFDAVLCSSLKRAQETCSLAGFEKKAHFQKNLWEWDYGAFEGQTSIQIQEKIPNWNIFTHGALQGESVEEAFARAKMVADSLQAYKTVLVFSHGHFLRLLTAALLKEDPSFCKHIVVAPATVSVLGAEKENNLSIFLWNFFV